MSVQQKPARKRLTSEARRDQILDAAERAFRRGGYHGTHVDHVIREAGIARGTFYLHFQSKHEVFEALVDKMLQVFLDVRPEIPEPDLVTLGDAEAVLRNSYRTIFEAFHRHRVLGRLLLEEAVGLHKGFAERIERHFDTWHERVRSTIALLAEKGIARRDLDLDLTADLVLGMVERLARRHLFVEERPDIARLVEAIVALELRGIRA